MLSGQLSFTFVFKRRYKSPQIIRFSFVPRSWVTPVRHQKGHCWAELYQHNLTEILPSTKFNRNPFSSSPVETRGLMTRRLRHTFVQVFICKDRIKTGLKASYFDAPCVPFVQLPPAVVHRVSSSQQEACSLGNL